MTLDVPWPSHGQVSTRIHLSCQHAGDGMSGLLFWEPALHNGRHNVDKRPNVDDECIFVLCADGGDQCVLVRGQIHRLMVVALGFEPGRRARKDEGNVGIGCCFCCTLDLDRDVDAFKDADSQALDGSLSCTPTPPRSSRMLCA